MDKQDFYNKFKEEIETLFNSSAAKADTTDDQYWEGKTDGIEKVERVFDQLWREFEKNP